MRLKPLKTKFHILSSLLITIFIFIITNENFLYLKPLRSIDQKIIDTYITRRGIQKPVDSLDVIIIGISNETMKELPQPYNSWPIARNLFAKAIENLNKAGARAIGIDLLFSEKDKYSIENDSLFLNTLKKYRNVVLAGKLEQVDWRYEVQNLKDINYGNIFYSADSSIGVVNVLLDEDGILRTYIPFYYDVRAERLLPSFSFAEVDKFL